MSAAHEFYDDYWHDPATAQDPLREKRLRLFLPILLRDARLLDVGCGAGEETHTIAAHTVSVVGLDISRRALAAARQAIPQGRWVCGSLEHGLPFAAGSFSVVYCSEVIEHVLDVKSALAELNRVLVTGGLLFLTTPYHGLVKNLAIALLAFERHYDPASPHIRFFTVGSLTRLLQQAGFVVEKKRCLGRFWPVWMNLAVWARKR